MVSCMYSMYVQHVYTSAYDFSGCFSMDVLVAIRIRFMPNIA